MADGGIHGRPPELKPQRLVERSVMADGRGMGRRGFWQRGNPFPPTKPHGRSPGALTCGRLSISPGVSSRLVRWQVKADSAGRNGGWNKWRVPFQTLLPIQRMRRLVILERCLSDELWGI